MAYSTQRAVSDGTMTYLDLSIAYLSRSHISVLLNGAVSALGVGWSWVGTTDTRIQFPAALPAGTSVLVKRTTKIDGVINVFAKGAKFSNTTMDEDFRQLLYLNQEAVEGAALTDIFNDVDFHKFKLVNLGDAVLDNQAVTLGQVKTLNNSAYTASVNSAASAVLASQWASQLATAVDGTSYSAKQYALNAATYRDAAATSAKNAGTSEGNAGTSASNAGISEANAKAYRDSAYTYSQNSAQSASDSKGYRDTAQSVAANVQQIQSDSTNAINLANKFDSRLSAAEANAQTAANTASVITGKNRIINGAMTVVQRTGYTAIASGGYGGPDRYQCVLVSGSASVTQTAITYLNRPALQQICVVPATDYSGTNYAGGITQFIEGINCFDLVGGTLGLSFTLYCTVAGTFAIQVSFVTSAGTYYTYVTTVTLTAAKVDQRFQLTIPTVPTAAAPPASNNLACVVRIGAIATGTYMVASANVGKWTQGNLLSAPGVTNWLATKDNVLIGYDIQLEAGYPTAFEREPYTTTLLKCLRYFQGACVLQGGASAYANNAFAYIQYLRTPMRVSPALTYLESPNCGNCSFTNIQANTEYVSATITVSAQGAYSYFGRVSANAEF